MFHIQDWSGNILLDGRTFETRDSAWDYMENILSSSSLESLGGFGGYLVLPINKYKGS